MVALTPGGPKRIFLLAKQSPEPVFLGNAGVTTDGVVLVGDPDDEDDVKGGRRVLEELGHDGFHA